MCSQLDQQSVRWRKRGIRGAEECSGRGYRVYLYEAYGNASVISITIWGRGMGVWRVAKTCGKCANEGSKNLYRAGETSSTGLPTVRDEHAAGEVGSDEENAGAENEQWQIVEDGDD